MVQQVVAAISSGKTRANLVAVHEELTCLQELWEPYNEPINEKADVHAIGNVMWKLITSVDSEDGAYAELTNRQTGLPVLLGSGQYHYDSAGELKEVSEYTLLGHYSYMRHVRAYSETLKQLVRDCLRWIPADRPSLQALRDAIEAQVDQHQKPPQDPNFRWNLNPDGRWSRAGRVEHVRYRLGGQLP